MAMAMVMVMVVVMVMVMVMVVVMVVVMVMAIPSLLRVQCPQGNHCTRDREAWHIQIHSMRRVGPSLKKESRP